MTVEQSTVTQLRQPNNKKFTIHVHVHATKLLRTRQKHCVAYKVTFDKEFLQLSM